MTTTQLYSVFFLTMLFGTTGFFLWMLGSYIFPVFWAVVIAIVFHPVYEFLLKIVRFKGLASVLTIVLAVAVIVIPILTVGGLVARETFSLYQSVSRGTADGVIEDTVGLLNSWLPINLEVQYVEDQVRQTVSGAANFITNSFLQYSQLTLGFFAKIFIAIYLLFFMFKYDTKILDKIVQYVPMDEKYLRLLFERFANTTQAIVQGSMTIAILQGTIGGLILWMAGVPAPVLWGVVITILSVIPAVGPTFVIIPAGVILILTGSVLPGILLIGIGAALVALVDEFLRPVLVGRRANIPDAFVLLATVGGIASFGITGLVIGPILAAFCLSLWAIFSEKYKTGKRTTSV